MKPSKNNEEGYLSCSVAEKKSSKAFYDLIDGEYSYEVWIEILKWFFALELKSSKI